MNSNSNSPLRFSTKVAYPAPSGFTSNSRYLFRLPSVRKISTVSPFHRGSLYFFPYEIISLSTAQNNTLIAFSVRQSVALPPIPSPPELSRKTTSAGVSVNLISFPGIFHHRFAHKFFLGFHVLYHFELSARSVQILPLPMRFEVCISFQIIGQEPHSAFVCH